MCENISWNYIENSQFVNLIFDEYFSDLIENIIRAKSLYEQKQSVNRTMWAEMTDKIKTPNDDMQSHVVIHLY